MTYYHQLLSLSFFLPLVVSINNSLQCKSPHIVFIVADDLGFNDVGFHGSAEIPTPNIDALAYSGVILNNYYVNPICTPSRSALMTGKYPIHTGMQHTVLFGAEPRGLPLSEKLLPEYLKELGYKNHIVGKWHLGSWKKEYTPLYRGFESHLGYWTGHQDYFDQTAMEMHEWGLDMRNNFTVAYNLHGQYSTDIFTKESIRIIQNHDTKQPLFLYVAHAAVHSGNPYNPLPAPDEEVAKFNYIHDYRRQRYAAMLSKLDESVGKITDALGRKGILDKSIIIFTSDNGGPAAGFNLNAASNYPLKGVKNTLWEGGVRGAAFIWSTLIENPSRVSKQMMQIVDWLPTLLGASCGNHINLTNLDAVNLWTALSNNEKSPRFEILHNIDDIYGNAALTVGKWKLVKGSTYNGQWDKWYGPSGRNYTYDFDLVLKSLAGQALKNVNKAPSVDLMKQLRDEATVNCHKETIGNTICYPINSPCLFDLDKDACEFDNVADKHLDIVDELCRRLQEIRATAVPPGNRPIAERGNPKYWNYVFTNFGDYEHFEHANANVYEIK